MKRCSKCKETKDKSEFNTRSHGRLRSRCKQCRIKMTSVDARARNFKIRYGITVEDYDQLLIQFDNSCGICKKHSSVLKRRLFVDHCHKTKQIRGLLCQKCNVGLGQFQDDTELLKSAIQYMDSSKMVDKSSKVDVELIHGQR